MTTTVQQLIDALSAYPADAPVTLGCQGQFDDLEEIHLAAGVNTVLQMTGCDQLQIWTAEDHAAARRQEEAEAKARAVSEAKQAEARRRLWDQYAADAPARELLSVAKSHGVELVCEPTEHGALRVVDIKPLAGAAEAQRERAAEALVGSVF